MTLEEVGIILGVELEVRKLTTTEPKFHASFPKVEVKDGGCLTSTFGRGSTPREARKDYAKELCGQRVVRGAYTKNRLEIILPPKISAR